MDSRATHLAVVAGNGNTSTGFFDLARAEFHGTAFALARTEAVTLITNGHVSDSVYKGMRSHFNEKVSDLTLAIAAIFAQLPDDSASAAPRHQ